MDNGKLFGDVLDYGCGRGGDADRLGIDGWDPNWRPGLLRKRYDTVICNYVLNTLPPEMWESVLASILKCLKPSGVAYISVRDDVRHGLDGVKRGGTNYETYQTYVSLALPIVVHIREGFTMYRLDKTT